MLLHISHLKGPFKISPQYYFDKIKELFSKYVKKGGEKGNMDFDIPVDNSEVVQINYDFLKFILEEGTTLFFLNHHSIYEILIIDQFSSKKHFNWHRFADKDKEGDELLIQMVENIAVFLKLKG